MCLKLLKLWGKKLFYIVIIELQQSFGSSQGLFEFALVGEVNDLVVQTHCAFILSPEVVVVAGTVRRADDVVVSPQSEFVIVFIDF
jgi:hypothetical protein